VRQHHCAPMPLQRLSSLGAKVPKTAWALEYCDVCSPTLGLDCRRGEPHEVHGSSSSNFWSGSPNADYSGYAWNVYFYGGSSGGGNRNNSNLLRLARGGE